MSASRSHSSSASITTTRATACDRACFIPKSGCKISFSNWSFSALCEIVEFSSSAFLIPGSMPGSQATRSVAMVVKNREALPRSPSLQASMPGSARGPPPCPPASSPGPFTGTMSLWSLGEAIAEP